MENDGTLNFIPVVRRDLEDRIGSIQARSLKEYKTALGDDYSYGEIYQVLAHLQHLANG